MLERDDEHLYALVRKGNEQAFKYFFMKYQPKLFVFCYSITGEEEIAKDLAQETFITFWEKRDTIITDYAVTAYLFKIGQGKCRDYLKRNNLKSNFSDLTEFQLSELELNYYEEEKDILDSLYYKEINNAYEKAIGKLPAQCRAVYNMSHKEELKSSEIASKLSLSLRTVENHLYRATKFIRDEMKRYALFLF